MTTQNPSIFARLTKVDEAKRLIYARAVQEVPDHADEIMDYESSKPYFESWSKSIFDATDGKSFGNVRAMHGNNVAGKLAEPLSYNDAEKAIDVCVNVVDDAEWKKVLEGCYGGLSMGGKYVGEKKIEKVDGKDIKRYTAKPHEISLVDVPCIPTATFFDVVKADGAIEKRAFTKRVYDGANFVKHAELLLKNENAKAPLAALAQLRGDTLEKGMYAVSDLACLLDRLQGIADGAEWERAYEGDSSTVPAALREAVKSLGAILVQMAAEEIAEMAKEPADNPDPVIVEVVTLAADGDLAKRLSDLGIADSAAFAAYIEKVQADAKAPADDSLKKSADLQNLLDESGEKLTKLQRDYDADRAIIKGLWDSVGLPENEPVLATVLLVKIADIATERANLIAKVAEQDKQIKKWLDAPASGKAIIRVVDKSTDVRADGEGETRDEVKPIKKADGTVDEGATLTKKLITGAPTVGVFNR